MPLNSIAVIVLRLFALNWLLHDIGLWALAVQQSLSGSRPPYLLAAFFLPALLLLVASAILWLLAPRIARLVSPSPDAAVALSSLTRYDLYCFGFVFLGLYFVLSSFAEVINWTHYFATVAHNAKVPDQELQKQNFYQLTRPGLTFVGGLISLFGASRWAKKLVRREEKFNEV
ncbi:hypothetical protein BH09VER1_BH09VER1_09120 [soil metagenome]